MRYRPVPLIVFLALWEGLSHLYPHLHWFLSSPSEFVVSFYHQIAAVTILWQAAVTLWEALAGTIAGMTLGTLLCAILVSNETLFMTFRPYVRFLGYLPFPVYVFSA